MNLTLDLTPLTGKSGIVAASMNPQSQKTAVLGEFSALLSMTAPLGEEAAAPLGEDGALQTGNLMPAESGNILPVAAAALPVQPVSLLAPAAIHHEITSPAANAATATSDNAETIGERTAHAELTIPAHAQILSANGAASGRKTSIEGAIAEGAARSARREPISPEAIAAAKPAPTAQASTAKADAALAPSASLTAPALQLAATASASAATPAAIAQQATAATPPLAAQAEISLPLGQRAETAALQPAALQPIAEILAPRPAKADAAATITPEAAAAELAAPSAKSTSAQNPAPQNAALQNPALQNPTMQTMAAAQQAASAAQALGETGEGEGEGAGELGRPAKTASDTDHADAPQRATKSAATSATSASSAPTLAAQAPATAANVIPAMVEAPRAMAAPANTAPEAAAPRHDFEAIVDKLAEAREMSRPGRADLHLAHREFGNVSVQFEMAGRSLKVALASGDASFAPAVQAALAERPVAGLSESARSDYQGARQDTASQQSNGQSSSQGSAHADPQRQEQQARNAAGRAANDPASRQNGQNRDTTTPSPRTARDGDLFA